MPILRITSLPFEHQDSAGWTTAVCERFAKITEIPIKHVSAIWHILPSEHYAYGGISAAFQPKNSHPILVEVSLPDLYVLDRVERIMNATVEAVCFVSQIPKDNIFVQVNRVRSGSVYDEGRVVRW